MVGRNRERKEKGGGKREKKIGKYVFGMERKMEGREKWEEKLWVGPTIFNPPKSGWKRERKEGIFLLLIKITNLSIFFNI